MSSRVRTAHAIERRLKTAAKPDRARALQRFFKTGPGEYGEGDRFLGLTVPQVRSFAAEFPDTPIASVGTLLESPWHECRLLALIMLADAYRRGNPKTQDRIYRLYLRRTGRINNWDLVDVSAPRIVGAHLVTRSRSVLYRLARSRRVWERRIAIIATLAFISRDDFTDTLRLAERLLADQQDLIHKAIGWMLREVGKRDETVLRRFLDRHAARMPRTALRYAIERLSPALRRHYMTRRVRPSPR